MGRKHESEEPGAEGASGVGKRSKSAQEPAEAKRTLRRYTPEERRRAVEAYQRSGQTQAMFARQWGVSPITLNFWVRKHRQDGPKGLEDRPRSAKPRGRAPLSSGTKEAILQTRRRFPFFGLKKV